MKLFTVTSRLEVQEGIHSSIMPLPLGDGMMKLISGIKGGVQIKAADLVTAKEGQRLVREGREQDRRAMVLLLCPDGCKLHLAANATHEWVEGHLVIRKPKPIEQAVGVQVLHQEQHALVSMLVRSSLRFTFEGPRPKGVPPQGALLWTGRYDLNRPTSGMSAFARTNKL